jgi:hypothetical protein
VQEIPAMVISLPRVKGQGGGCNRRQGVSLQEPVRRERGGRRARLPEGYCLYSGFLTGKHQTKTMHELAAVLKDRKGLFWIAVTAFLYALVLVPFNLNHWDIFGVTLRPAAVLPVVLGILYGPAAAWGLAIGNVAGDLSGSWSLMSIFGFLINFLEPYLAYRLWHRLMKGHAIRPDLYGMGCFFLVTFFVTLACMLLLAGSGTIFFDRPFESKFVSYFGNNIFWSMVAGPVLFWLIAAPAVRSRFVYGREWNRRITTATT